MENNGNPGVGSLNLETHDPLRPRPRVLVTPRPHLLHEKTTRGVPLKPINKHTQGAPIHGIIWLSIPIPPLKPSGE